MKLTRIYVFITAFVLQVSFLKAQTTEQNLTVNHQFAPKWWQTAINLPESSRKVLVGKNGALMYEYPAAITDSKVSPVAGFGTLISFEAGENESWKGQQLSSAVVPMVITQQEWKNISVKEEAFTVAPLLFGTNDGSLNDNLGTSLSGKVSGKPGNDIIIVTLENKGNAAVSISPRIIINTIHKANIDTAKGKVVISDFLRVVVPYSIMKSTMEPVKKTSADKNRNQVVLTLKPFEIASGEKVQLAFGVSQGYSAIDCPNNLPQALLLQKQSVAWWQNLPLPYTKIIVPDVEIQNLLKASIRNIYQLADREKESVILKTGASSNRQFFISDAPFIIDALTMLNETEYAGKAIDNLFTLQKNDGAYLQQEKDWKATGLALWSISNYARLTGDKQWLESVWPRLEKGFNFLIELRNNNLDNKAAHAGLIPPGIGNDSQGIDYVNNYWALAGLNSAITAARWVGRNGQAIKWQSQYDDYYKAFLESVNKNMKKDAHGNSYLPVRTSDKKMAPQKSQWSFLNAVYPGKIFDLNNPLVTGSMKMLEKSLKEGLVVNSGWMNNGIVLATASDYAHALQWTGKAQEALRVMYAMANHAAPNMAWFEQQAVKNNADTLTAGDMPNSRVGAEFIRLVRHMIVIERGYELHLLEGIPTSWTKPGMEISLNDVLTEFGPLTFKLKVSEDGTTATLDMNLNTANRRPPQKVILHLDGIAGNPATMELELKPNLHKVLKLD